MQEQGIVLNIEIGVIKELFKQDLLTENQMQKAINILKQKYIHENSNEGNC